MDSESKDAAPAQAPEAVPNEEPAAMGARLFKKMSYVPCWTIFVIALTRSTDAKLLKDFEEVESKGLLATHFNVNQLFPNTKGGNVQTTLLHLAVAAQRNTIVEWLLAHGADPNAKNGKGETPLHTALDGAKRGKGKELIQDLVRRGASVDAADSAGETVTARAAKMSVDMGKILARVNAATAAAAGPSAGDDSAAVTQAGGADAGASSSAAEAAQSSDVGRRTSMGKGSALDVSGQAASAAAADGSSGAQAASDSAAELEKRKKALRAAVEEAKALTKLISNSLTALAGAAPDSQERDAAEAQVMRAIADSKNAELIQSKGLLDRPSGANDRTFLQMAAESARPLLVHAMLKAKADPNKQDSSGESALHIACKGLPNTTAVVDVLLADNRTDVALKSYLTAQTPLDAAGDRAAELKAMDRGKTLKIKVMRLIAELNEKQKAAFPADATLPGAAAAGTGAAGAASLSSGAASSAQDGAVASGSGHASASGLPSFTSPTSARGRPPLLSGARDRTASVPRGRPAPSAEFGTLLALGPAKDTQYGADYVAPPPATPWGAVFAMSTPQASQGSAAAAEAALKQAKRPARRSAAGTDILSSAQASSSSSSSSASSSGGASSRPAPTTAGRMGTGATGGRRMLGGAAAAATLAAGTGTASPYQSFEAPTPPQRGGPARRPGMGGSASAQAPGTPALGSSSLSAASSGQGVASSAANAELAKGSLRRRVSAGSGSGGSGLGLGGGAAVAGGTGAGEKIVAVNAGAASLYASLHQTLSAGALAAAGLTQAAIHTAVVRQAFTTLNPGAPPPSAEAIDVALQLKGPLSATTLRDILEVLVIANARSSSMQWDFAMADFHAATVATPAPSFGAFVDGSSAGSGKSRGSSAAAAAASAGQLGSPGAAPGWASASAYSGPASGLDGSSASLFGSPYSLGAIPANKVALIASLSSVDRSGAVQEKTLQAQHYRDVLREAENTQAQQAATKKGPKDKGASASSAAAASAITAAMAASGLDQFGRVSSESWPSAQWRQVEAAGLADDIPGELNRLGFAYPAVM